MGRLGSHGSPLLETEKAFDPNVTRTSRSQEVMVGAGAAEGSVVTRSERVETSPPERMDGAAISFARERERALERLDHSASVSRLRRAMAIGLSVWSTTIFIDLFVTQVAGEGSLAVFEACRAVAASVGIAVLWRLGRKPEPSMRVLWFCDILAFTTASVCLSVISLAHRGIESPFAPAVALILLARGATTLSPWYQGAWLFAAPALAYPIVVSIAAALDPRIAAQLHDPHGQSFFLIVLYTIAVSWAMLVFGGHFAWRLRRQVVETRNIGRYELLRRLGAGGGGDVWAAFDRTLKQRVAIKTVAGHRPGSLELMRLEREVRAMAELTHPNTVRVFDYGVTEDGLWYYAMELLHGENLRDLVTREGPLSAVRLCRIGRQVLRALGEAHDKGIVHRDVKPENVFIAHLGGEVDFVKLLDFGIAQTSGDTRLTRPGFVPGTPAYMAPEIILGHPADVRSDIYSFGATVYFALTARLPFQDEDRMALFAAHVSRPLGTMSAVTEAPIPPALERLVQRCMAKEPAERYASTRAVLEALEQGDSAAGSQPSE